MFNLFNFNAVRLIFSKTSRKFFSPFVSNYIIAHRLFSARSEITYMAPLYLLSENENGFENWESNIDEEKYNQLTQYLHEKPSTIDVFDYVYGILHDPVYYEQYEQYLCRNFPKVPIINDKTMENEDGAFFVSENLFNEYVVIGSQLRKLHLMDVKSPIELSLEPNTSYMEIGAIKYKNGILQLNEKKQIHGIPKRVWEYEIGGYKVLDKWFKEHKCDILTIDTFTHIENIAGLLEETIKLKEYLRTLH